MTILEKKDFLSYRCKPIFVWGLVSVLVNFATIMWILKPPFSITVTSLLLAWTGISYLCLFTGTIWLNLADSTKNHRKLMHSWRKITRLPLSAIPLNKEEAAAAAPFMENILKAHAATANNAIKHRSMMQTALNIITITPSGMTATNFGPKDLKAFRRERAMALCKLTSATKNADRRHREYLAAWDFFVQDCGDSFGFLAHLKSQDPEVWRSSCPS